MLGISFCLMVTRLNLFSKRRSRASFTYLGRNLDLDTRRSKEIAFSPVGICLPRPPEAPTVSLLNGPRLTDSFISISLS